MNYKLPFILIILFIKIIDSGLAQELENISKPNILLITSDQLIPFLMGTYGHPEVITPNLDDLAENGILFDNAYTPNPICAPARARRTRRAGTPPCTRTRWRERGGGW